MSRTPENRRAPELDELLAQAGWMRSLARSLVADPVEAEEVVQDAWVVALRERAAVRMDLAAWLRSVVRHLALRRLGREGARSAVERHAVRSDAGGAPAITDAIERMELQRWLAEALLALDEPYRSAVILRHVEGLDPGAIARRQGCSREAVRQRIARGLARLRSTLDARPGGRGQWCLVLAPLAARPGGLLPTTLTLGGIVMGSKAVLGSLVAAVAVALVWLALARDAEGPARAGTPAPDAQASVELVAVPAANAPAPRAPARESAVAPAAAAPAESVAPAEPLDPLYATLSGRVVDAEARPLSGADVVVWRREAGHFSMLDLEQRRRPKEVARAVTAADGRFAFVLERGIPFDLAVAAPDACDELLGGRYAGEELEVVLAQGFLVHGRVTRARDGAPIAAARVRAFRLNHGYSGERATTTDANGEYRLRFTFPDAATLEVTPQREMGSDWESVVPGPDGTVRKDFVLADGVEVIGTVREAGTGQPIEAARVGEGWTFRRSATTDAAGAYRMSGFGVSGVQELHARAEGFGGAQRSDLPAAVDGVMRVDFELPRGRLVRGRVVDPAKGAVVGAYVAAVASEFVAEGQATDWISGRTDALGRFELRGLTPAVRHCLMAGAEGFATVVYDFPADELATPELALDDVVLAPAAVLAGTVQDEEGNAVADVEVVLEGANADRGRFRGDSPLQPAGDFYVDSRSARCDARGRFWFGALPAGAFEVYARTGGRSDGPRVPVALGSGEMRDGFVLLYPRGESIRGTIVDAEGNGLGGTYVGTRMVEPRGGGPPDPRGVRAERRTDADGAFELAGLPPGTYRLDVYPWHLESDPDSPWLETTLERVETGGEPLRIVLARGQSIRGRAVDVTGAALVGYRIAARSPAVAQEAYAGTQGDGSFALAVPRGTVWDLTVSTVEGVEVHVEPNVPGGTRELVLRVDVAARSSGR